MNKQTVLQNCTVDGNAVRLPEQLDRKLYLEVAKALKLIGGKWKGGKTQAFLFNQDPTDLLADIAGGKVRNLKKEFQFFATPPELARRLVMHADLLDEETILEPSAGQGAIIEEINNAGYIPDYYELMPVNKKILDDKIKQKHLNANYIGDDFLQHGGKLYDRVIANPPFTKNQDIDHVYEMYNVLKKGGILVSITSKSWETGSQNKQIKFREWLDTFNFEIINLPPGTFKSTGTMVGGNILIIYK